MQRQRFDPSACSSREELGRDDTLKWQSERATGQPTRAGVPSAPTADHMEDSSDTGLFDGSEDAELEIRRMIADMESSISRFADLEAELKTTKCP